MRGDDNYFPKREFPVHSSSADCIVIECEIRSTQPLLGLSVFRTNYTCASFNCNLFPLVRNHHRVVEWIRRVSKKKPTILAETNSKRPVYDMRLEKA